MKKMKNLGIAGLFFIFSNILFGEAVYSGNIYNIKQKGNAYYGTLQSNIKVKKNDELFKIISSKGFEILRVNGVKNENNIYSIGRDKLKIDFIYRGNNIQTQELIDIADMIALDGGESGVIQGKLDVEFRKQGKININVKNDMDFGVINTAKLRDGIKSRKDVAINLKLSVDKKDVEQIKFYFEYPAKIELAEGKLIVDLKDDRNNASRDFISIDGIDNIRMEFAPKSANHTETINISGNLKSSIENIPPGRYTNRAKIRAYYEYSNFSNENLETNNKLVVRR